MSIADRLTEMVAPIAIEHNFRLWDLKVTKAGKRSIVSIVLDKDGGATLDEIAEMSKCFAPVLDEDSSLGDSYHLEVASPGLERNLSKREHFEWSVNTDVTISHRVEGSIARTKGKIISVDDNNVVIKSESLEVGTLSIPFESITKAHTLFDFDAAMKRTSDAKEELNEEALIPQGESA